MCALLALAILGAACRRATDEQATRTPPGDALFRPTGWVTRNAGGVRVSDASGAAFAPMPRARLVSVAPSTTEILFALGLGDRVVGVTTNCNYPPEARTKDKVGDYNLDYERIVALRPDLAVGVQGFTDFAREPLSRAGIRYYATAGSSLADVVESLAALGVLLGAQDAADGLIAQFNAAALRARERAGSSARVSVFWAQWTQPLSTVGPGNFHHDLIELAGGTNIAADLGAPYGPFSEEVLAVRAPQVVLALGQEQADWIRTRFPTIPAVRTGRLHVFDSDAAARPGPRLTEALDALSHLLYPSP
jgi:iron complex transport system substrate-binding protein